LSELEEDADEDEGPASIIVENESYVNLKKRSYKRYDRPAKSLFAENSKICRQFQMKQVLFKGQRHLPQVWSLLFP
jgi:ATP-dependent RNA helicase DHX57